MVATELAGSQPSGTCWRAASLVLGEQFTGGVSCHRTPEGGASGSCWGPWEPSPGAPSGARSTLLSSAMPLYYPLLAKRNR